MIEVELKCRLTPTSLERVQEKLHQCVFWGQKQNRDIYYDTPTWDLLRQAVFLRVRNETRLEWKFNPEKDPGHHTSIEHVFSLQAEPFPATEMNAWFRHFLPAWQDGKDFVELLANGRLVELARIEKIRRLYRSPEQLELSLDEVAGLGTFLEIEGTCTEEEEAKLIRQAATTLVSALSLVHLPVGYVELWLQEHKPEAYKVGQYQL